MSEPRAALPVLLGVVVVDLIGFGIVVPILPYLAVEYGAGSSSGIWIGVLLSSYAAAQFVFAPLWGRLSDRVGRRPVMLATIAGTAVSLLLLGFARSLATLLAARLLAGAFAANVSVASAYVADATDEQERPRWMGLIGAAFGVGFLLGPTIGGMLSPWGHSVPILTAAGLAAANWIHAALRLVEIPHRAAGGREAGLVQVLRAPSVLWLCVCNLVFALSVTQLESIFQLFLMDRFEFDALRTGLLMGGMALVMVAIQGGGMRKLAARFSERSLVWVGAALMGLTFAAVPATSTLSPLLLLLGFGAVGRAVTQPSLLSLVSKVAPAGQRGAAMGAFQSAASLARVFGPFAAGWLYDRRAGAPFVLAAGLAAGLSLLARALPERMAPAADASAAPTAGA